MVNGDVMGTGFASFTLAKAAGTRHAVGAVSRQNPAAANALNLNNLITFSACNGDSRKWKL
jgi:hypothetical protein